MKRIFCPMSIACQVTCTVFLLLLPAPGHAGMEMPARWIKLSFMDLTMEFPFNCDVRCVEIALGRTPNLGFGVGTALTDMRVFYSIAPSELSDHWSMFPVSLYYMPAVRWTQNRKPMPAALLCLTYGRMWFAGNDSALIASQNCISSSCFVAWQRGIPLGLKASIIYTFSDDGQTTHFTLGVGGTFSLGVLKGFGRRND